MLVLTNKSKTCFQFNLHSVYVFVTIVFAISLRIWLILSGWPRIDSDEGTMGLAALHIAFKGEHPIFFYGQNYMGTLEAYIASPIFHLFGISVFSLRLGLIILFILFIISIYFLTKILYTKETALTSILLISLGTPEVLVRQLAAAGGYMDTLAFGSIMMLLALWLSLSFKQSISKQRQLYCLVGFVCWGITVGLGLWSDLLILPFVLMSAFLLIFTCWQRLGVKVLMCVCLGFVLGASPLIAFNLTASPTDNSLSTLLHILYTDEKGRTVKPPVGQEVAGAVLVGLPVATGATSLCSISPNEIWPLSSKPSTNVIQCTIIHGVWGMTLIVLWIVAIASVTRVLWSMKIWKLNNGASLKEEEISIRYFGRFMLLGSAGITFALFALSPAAAIAPFPCTRYLIGLLVATPAIISLLLNVKSAAFTRTISLSSFKGFIYKSLLLLYCGGLLSGAITTVNQAHDMYKYNYQQNTFIHTLLERGITHIYSDYWTCDRIMFQSSEQIICSVLTEYLQPGQNRYPLYSSLVNQYLYPSYVLSVGTSQLDAFKQKLKYSDKHYQEFLLGEYVVYQPIQPFTNSS